MHRIDVTIKQEAAKLRAEMKEGFASFRTDLAKAKREMIAWMIVCCVGQLVAVVVIVFGAGKLLK
jgi:hypothetical protein